MGLYINSEDKVLISNHEFIAAQKPDGFVYIWDNEGEVLYGRLPCACPISAFYCLVESYREAHERGQECGISQAQRVIKSALGLD